MPIDPTIREHRKRIENIVQNQREQVAPPKPCNYWHDRGTPEMRRCKAIAVVGATVCKRHGGNVTNTARAAVNRTTRDILHHRAQRNIFKRLNITIQSDPMEGILREVTTSSLMVEAYQEMLSEMDVRDPFFGVLVQEFGVERDRHVKFSKTAIDANIQERQQKLNEHMAMVLMALLMDIFQDSKLGLTAEQIATGRKVIATKIRAAVEARQVTLGEVVVDA